MTKTYEILKGLPGTGPMYLTVRSSNLYTSDYSEGFVVKFIKSNGEEWIANFNLGFTQFNAVFDLEHTNLLIIAGGLTYVMNPEHEIPATTFNTNYKGGFQVSNGCIILYDNSEITLFEKDGSFWISEQISLDGLRNISIKNNIVTGQYSDYSRDWEWFDFTLNIDNKEITGIKQHHSPKPWWKIW